MCRYRSGQFGSYLRKINWNRRIQDLGTLIIGILAGIYFDLEPGEQDKFLKTAGIIMAVCGGIKILIYLSIIDLNTLKGQHEKKRGIDINGILREIPGIIMGIAFGKLFSPVTSAGFLGFRGKTEFADPFPWIMVILGCVFVLILLESKAVNFNRGGKSVQPGRIWSYLGNYDWNDVFHELCSIFIGIGIGFFLVETGIADGMMGPVHRGLGFAKNIDGEAKKWGFGGFGKEFGKADKILGKIGKISEKMMASCGEKGKTYVGIGMAMVGISIFIKILMYIHVFDANRMRDALLKGR